MIISDATFPIIGSMYHRVLLHIWCPFYGTEKKHFTIPTRFIGHVVLCLFVYS